MPKLRAGYNKRSNGLLQHRFTYGGIRCAVYGRTYGECEEKKLAKIEAIKNGQSASADYIKLEDYYKEWQQGREGTIAKSTRYTNDVRWKRVDELIGGKRIKDIEPRTVRNLQHDLSEKLSVPTVNDTMTLLNSVMEGAIEDRIISHNPCRGLKPLINNNSRAYETYHRALTIEEETLFFKYAKFSWYYGAFAFMISTGARIGEVGALTWNDVDFRNNMIHINKAMKRVSNTEREVGPPKTRASIRDIPILDSLKTLLIDMKSVGMSGDRNVFASPSGQIVTKDSVNNEIRKILRQIEKVEMITIEDFTSHAFRDTFATRAIEQGMTPQTLKTILGHSNLRTTMDLYAHVLPNTKQEEMAKIRIAI